MKKALFATFILMSGAALALGFSDLAIKASREITSFNLGNDSARAPIFTNIASETTKRHANTGQQHDPADRRSGYGFGSRPEAAARPLAPNSGITGLIRAATRDTAAASMPTNGKPIGGLAASLPQYPVQYNAKEGLTMLNHPFLLICLWLFPVVTLLVVPLLLSPIGLLRDLFSSEELTEEPIWQTLPPESEGKKKSWQDLRAYPRLAADGIVAHVSDGTSYCMASVKDISKSGIGLINPANILDTQAERLGVLLTGLGKCVQMQVKPRWKKNGGDQMLVGATVLDNHWNWEEFTKHFELAQSA